MGTIRQPQTNINTASQIDGEYIPSNYTPTSTQVDGHLEGIDNALLGLADKYLVTVGAVGADYTNLNDAIDAVRLRNGGIIKLIDELYNYSSGGVAKDVSNITFIGKSATVAGSSVLFWNSGAGAWTGDNVSFVGIAVRGRPGSSGNLLTASGTGRYYFRDCLFIIDGSTSPSLATSLFNFNSQEINAYLHNCYCNCPSIPGNRKIFTNDSSSTYWITGRSRLNADTPNIVYRDAGSEICGTTVITSDNLIDASSKVTFDNTISSWPVNNVQDAIDYIFNNYTVLPNQQQILYVGKHGNDLNSGLNIEQAVLTFGQALILANALVPSPNNQVTVICLDSGIYQESITIPSSYIHIFAPNAIIQGTAGNVLTIPDNVKVKLQEIQVPDTFIGVLLTTGNPGTSIVEIETINLVDTAKGIQNQSASCDLIAHVKTIRVDDGTGVGDNTTTMGNIKLFIDEIILTGTSPIGIAQMDMGGGGIITGYVNTIIENGATTATGIDLQAGTIELTAKKIYVNTAYNVGVAGILSLTVDDMGGIETNNNIVKLIHLSGGTTGQVIKTLDALGNVNWSADDAKGIVITQINSGLSPYTPLATDNLIVVDCTAGNVVIDLEPVINGIDGDNWQVLRIDASLNTLTITANSGGDLINGANSFSIGAQYNTYRFVKDQTQNTYWVIT